MATERDKEVLGEAFEDKDAMVDEAAEQLASLFLMLAREKRRSNKSKTNKKRND